MTLKTKESPLYLRLINESIVNILMPPPLCVLPYKNVELSKERFSGQALGAHVFSADVQKVARYMCMMFMYSHQSHVGEGRS